MNVVDFLTGNVGRILHYAVGAALLLGSMLTEGAAAWLLIVVGAELMVAGVVGATITAPLLHQPLRGHHRW